jgi:hypothetical protein
MDPGEGKMPGTPNPETISTRLHRIAKRAREMPGVALRTRAQYLDSACLREAYRRTRKDGAVGVDQQTAERQGSWVIKRKTARDRLSRALRAIAQWCRQHRHAPVSWQHAVLSRKLRGHVLSPRGRERTEGEFRSLLAAAGLGFSRVVATGGFSSIVEAVKP